MKNQFKLWLFCFLFTGGFAVAQEDQVINNIVKEAEENSKLEQLAHELLDVVGPRLVGTPQMNNAHEWAVDKFESWGIPAEKEKWGEWRGWSRGVTHIDMVSPRVQSLEGTQLAWSAPTSADGVTGEVIAFPQVQDSVAFQNWLSNVKGKFVMTSMPESTGRPDYQWEEFATEESFEKMRRERMEASQAWRENMSKTGYNSRTLTAALEQAGAAGIVTSRWSRGYGVNKIFGASSREIPTLDISLEDYGMLYRLAESGNNPEIRVIAQSEELGTVPTFNTIATIRGTEKPEEYVVLSAHFDSWDGATGATDNGTGTIVMMEAARILKEVYPNPKRTIIIGLWGSEEQGLNGSRAFVEDHPEIIKNIQAVFNQDNGTGRVVNISGQGFLHAYDYLGDWLEEVPRDVTQHIETSFPGSPAGGGSDYASFLAAGVPAFNLSALSWDYGTYTWHTNRDTYDKIVFDDVRNNAILTAALAYMASEDEEMTSREQINLPNSRRTGEQMEWPTPRSPTRQGGTN